MIQQEVHPNRTMPLLHKSLRRSGNFPCDSVKSSKSHRRIYLLLAYFTILGGKLVSRDMVVNENGPKADVLNSVLLAEAFSDGVSQLNEHNLGVSFSTKHSVVTPANKGSSSYSPSLHQGD